MPHLVIKTNVPKDKIRSTILKDLSKVVSDMLGKPEKFVAIEVVPSQWMSFGGTEEPCAVCRLTSVNQFDAESNRNYSKTIMKYLCDAIGASDDRIYLQFKRETRESMGYKSDTFFGLLGPSK